jgi:NAD(P)H dehydrogenase (quinone)
MLIIYANPNKLGFSGFFLKSIQKELQRKKIQYEVLDLYEMNYESALKIEEHYTSGHYEISDQNKEIQEKIANTNKLIFIYPIWWQNMPAILKGFVDRVFTPRFAFRYIGKFPMGLLKNKKAVVFTNSGAPRLLSKFIFGDRGIKVMTQDTLKFCGIKAKNYSLGSARELNDSQKLKIEKLVNKGLKFLKA